MAYTFTTLKTAIQDYTQNTESTFVNQLSRFIVNAEERILKECQLDVFRKSSQGSTSSGIFIQTNGLSGPEFFECYQLLEQRVSIVQTGNCFTRLYAKPCNHRDSQILC